MTINQENYNSKVNNNNLRDNTTSENQQEEHKKQHANSRSKHVDTIGWEFQQFMSSHRVTTLTNEERLKLFEWLVNMQPLEVNIPAKSTNTSNISPIENDDKVGDLPDLQAIPRRHGLSIQPQEFAINPNAMLVASGGRNLYVQQSTPYPGKTPVSRQQYIGNTVSFQGGFFPTTPTVSADVGYQELIPTLYLVENMKSAVPKLKKAYTNSCLEFARNFCTNLIFNNLCHMMDKWYMKAMLPTS